MRASEVVCWHKHAGAPCVPMDMWVHMHGCLSSSITLPVFSLGRVGLSLNLVLADSV